jgi:hypothetical protein
LIALLLKSIKTNEEVSDIFFVDDIGGFWLQQG